VSGVVVSAVPCSVCDMVDPSRVSGQPSHIDRSIRSAAAAVGPHHRPRLLTDGERAIWRQRSEASRTAKQAATRGLLKPLHDLNVPKLDPYELMPQLETTGTAAISLFSGGGGLDLGFARSGYVHAASFEILSAAADTLRATQAHGEVFGGSAGDVTGVDWRKWRGAELVHGGPPCQPFSIAGRQRGHDDERDMWPAYVDCILTVRPRVFVAENVPALGSLKFDSYVRDNILKPLGRRYSVQRFVLRAEDFGVPQIRRRVFFVGFARQQDADRFRPPVPTHAYNATASPMETLWHCMGAREALGLPDIGLDALSPTIRSTLTGPRHTTSILNSVAAQRTFAAMQIWPNGVAPSRYAARAFPASNGHFRLSVPDVALLQGFPEDWPFQGATYMKLGQIGNAVPPPLGYAVGRSVSAALA
jgi:DNA (cytosine-5)-methyltransferase 1